jgi:hypothetical protein
MDVDIKRTLGWVKWSFRLHNVYSLGVWHRRLGVILVLYSFIHSG